VATDEPLLASVAGRYASALFDLATEQGKAGDVEADLAKVEALISESGDFARMLRSPVIPAEEQGRALAAVFSKAGLGPLATNFFQLIAAKRRLFAAEDMIKAYRTLAAKARGEVAAEVATAHPLSDAQTATLKDTLKAQAGKDVTLSVKVDPSLLGGLVVKMGSRMIDSSLKTRLAGLRVALKGGA
jgi:F-type H+-transporting ATPase subunit delta